MQKYLCLSSFEKRRFFVSMGISKYDNNFKQLVLLKGIDKQVAQVKKQLYHDNKRIVVDNDGIVTFDYSIGYSLYLSQLSKYSQGYNLIDCADRLLESKYRKTHRVKNKISHLIISNNAIFITLTFNDKTLSKTDALKRRRLVQRYLKENCKEYVANVDYGGKKGREHYHAVVSQDIVFDNWYKYGAINVERVRPCEDSPSRISKYITKLTNHALKVGAIAPRLIYSRHTI